MREVRKTISPMEAARILECSSFEVRKGLECGDYTFGKCISRKRKGRKESKAYIIYADEFYEYVKQNAEMILRNAQKQKNMLKAVMCFI